jgi:hypothetical protein
MNTNTTSRRGRYAARAAAIATTAIIFGTAACGTETASDGEPAAPAAPAPQAQATPHSPTSADNAERQGAAGPKAKYRRQSMHAPGTAREIPIP